MSHVAPDDPHLDEPQEPLYAARRQIYPQSVKVCIVQSSGSSSSSHLAFIISFPLVNNGPRTGCSGSGGVVDLPHRCAYFFFIEIWPAR